MMSQRDRAGRILLGRAGQRGAPMRDATAADLR